MKWKQVETLINRPSVTICGNTSLWLVENKKNKKNKKKKILQGLGVGPGSVTERLPCRKNRYSFQLCQNMGGNNHGSFPEVGERQKAQKKEEKEKKKKRRKKQVKTMASYTSVHNHGWRTQAAWTNFSFLSIPKVGERQLAEERREKENRRP